MSFMEFLWDVDGVDAPYKEKIAEAKRRAEVLHQDLSSLEFFCTKYLTGHSNWDAIEDDLKNIEYNLGRLTELHLE